MNLATPYSSAPTPEEAKKELGRRIEVEVARRIAQRRFTKYQPYEWQKKFHNGGKDNKHRLLMAANGVGKTFPGAWEVVAHLTGEYPDWYEGFRFHRPVKVWTGSISNQAQREFIQPYLFGADLGENFGTGFISRDRFVGKPKIRQAGMADVADIASIKHISGGVSTIALKTYEQGWRAWQGGAPDVLWGDEQPDENNANERGIWSEMQTRVFRSGGLLFMTLTPLLGETDMIRHFLYPKAKGIYWIGATWDDAPHLLEEEKERLRSTYMAHELEVRTKGVPMMGQGRVFSMLEDDIKVFDFEIPAWFARIKGIDFGIAHPAAVADIAWDRDKDIIYVTRIWREENRDTADHAAAINSDDPWVPVAWPHDGTNREKGSGRMLKTLYAEFQVRMLGRSACYRNDILGSQKVEPIVQEIEKRMIDGRFKVFASCKKFFEELRGYHRKDGMIVARRDDALKAVFYAVMMRRYATVKTTSGRRRQQTSAPIASARI